MKNNQKYYKEEKIKDYEHCPIAVLKGGSDAHHLMGNLTEGCTEDDEFIIHWESENFFYGNFLTGLGFIDVRVQKEDLRELTKEEIERITGSKYYINSTPVGGPINGPEDIWRNQQ